MLAFVFQSRAIPLRLYLERVDRAIQGLFTLR